MYSYVCQICSETFQSKISPTAKKPPKYCSWECQHQSMRKRIDIACKICGKSFKAPHHDSLYCSHNCFHKARQLKAMKPCEQCGEMFLPDRRAIKHCSAKCYGKSMLSKHPRKEKEFSKAVRRAIKERDNKTCVLCGSTHKIQVDHIIAIALGGDNSIENGRVLCHTCHVKKTTDDKRKIKALNKNSPRL